MTTAQPPAPSERWLRAALYAGWLALIVALAAQHVMWRDEVRALSLALSGDDVIAMLRGIHGEGHPALWYLMLRGAYAVVPSPIVLPVVSVALAAVGGGLLVWRSPFRPLTIALILFGGYMVFDYAVIARNYGISALLMFLIADRYAAGRERGGGIVLGALLALLCNTNVPAILLVGGFQLFWLLDLVSEPRPRPAGAWRAWTVAAAFALAGALAAFLTVYPPYNDAAVTVSHLSLGARVWIAITDPLGLADLMPSALWPFGGIALPLAVVTIGAVFGLARRPAAMIAAATVYLALQLFFHLVYPGGYRHEALFIVFLIAMYWLAVARPGDASERQRSSEAVARVGGALFLVLLAAQIPGTIGNLATVRAGTPFSRSRDLGAILARPGLRDAIVIGHPDWMLEPAPYYAANPTYLLRQHALSRVTRFSHSLPRVVTLGDYLATARGLQQRTGRPVVIVLAERLEPGMKGAIYDDGMTGKFSASATDIANFLAATQRLARFGPAVTNETYDVYLLR